MEKQIKDMNQQELNDVSEFYTEKLEILNKQIHDLTKLYKTFNQKRNMVHHMLRAKRYNS